MNSNIQPNKTYKVTVDGYVLEYRADFTHHTMYDGDEELFNFVLAPEEADWLKNMVALYKQLNYRGFRTNFEGMLIDENGEIVTFQTVIDFHGKDFGEYYMYYSYFLLHLMKPIFKKKDLYVIEYIGLEYDPENIFEVAFSTIPL